MNYHEKYAHIYNDERWKKIVKARFWLADGLCEECWAKGIVKAGKETHHIVPISKNIKKAFELDNTILLCSDCHNAKHERVSPLQKFLTEFEGI